MHSNQRGGTEGNALTGLFYIINLLLHTHQLHGLLGRKPRLNMGLIENVVKLGAQLACFPVFVNFFIFRSLKLDYVGHVCP